MSKLFNWDCIWLMVCYYPCTFTEKHWLPPWPVFVAKVLESVQDSFEKGQRIHGAVFLQHSHGGNILPVGVRLPWTILKGCQQLEEVPLRELKGVLWKLCHRRCSVMIQDQLFFNSLVIKGFRSAWNAIFRLVCFVLKQILRQ